ncbi:MAG: pilus assembly protein N-terminal domain-containing protein [Rhizobiaceae bacterium]|nr:pilus assembly protein N-terminal domain-containing protein [Rhizobiaceae bacterium]
MYKLIATLFLAASTGLLSGLPSAAEQVSNSVVVTVDQAKIFRVSRPAGTIIIGNPAIVDATVEDDQTLVLTGRSFGVTNLIVLDPNGDAIVDQQVTVRGHEFNTVRIYRGGLSRETMACATGSPCEPTLTIGDDNEAFSLAREQIQGRNQLSEGNAN